MKSFFWTEKVKIEKTSQSKRINANITISLLIQVTFYKRAQILVADIWGCFEGQGIGFFADIDCITMFADYR